LKTKKKCTFILMVRLGGPSSTKLHLHVISKNSLNDKITL